MYHIFFIDWYVSAAKIKQEWRRFLEWHDKIPLLCVSVSVKRRRRRNVLIVIFCLNGHIRWSTYYQSGHHHHYYYYYQILFEMFYAWVGWDETCIFLHRIPCISACFLEWNDGSDEDNHDNIVATIDHDVDLIIINVQKASSMQYASHLTSFIAVCYLSVMVWRRRRWFLRWHRWWCCRRQPCHPFLIFFVLTDHESLLLFYLCTKKNI